MKYLTNIVTTNDHSLYLKNHAIKCNIHKYIQSILEKYDKKDLEGCYNELNKIMEKFKHQPTIYTDLIKFWHIFYDYLTSKHQYSLFSIPIHSIDIITSKLKINYDNGLRDTVITMTTCKRMDLTYRTINSMLNCITDLTDYVSEFIIVDDNSSEDDRTALEKAYPFIRLIRKTPDEKGHPRSMNMIFDLVKEYVYHFHIEDDWEFFYTMNYISKCKKVLSLNSNYGQCLINRDYGEDQLTINTIGGSEMKTYDDGIYYEHRYFAGDELQREVAALRVNNNLYWPHFSFRVGLNKVDMYSKVGKFNEKASHFEMEYGHRYTHLGYKTAFLDRVYCTHIGRRTYERNDKTKTNAYELNEEKQFGENKSNQSTNTSTPQNKENNNLKISAFVLNLKRRKDRLLTFIKENTKELPCFKIIEAVDGSKLEPNSKIQRLFQTGDYKYRRGIIGVAYSMIKIWKEFVTDPNSDYAIILEDDIKLTQSFIPKVIELISSNEGKFDVILGHMNLYQSFNNKMYYSTTTMPSLTQYSTQKMMSENMGSLAVTILTKKGAENLLNEVNEKGVYNAIDWVVMKTCDKQKVCVTVPFLGFADCYQANNNKDTDIQKDYSMCGLQNWIQFEINYWRNVLTPKGKKSSNSRVVYTEDSSLVQLLIKYKMEVVKLNSLNDIKSNDIVILNKSTINTPVKNISICPLKTSVEVGSISRCYPTDLCKFVVPFTMLNDELMKDKTWGIGYLNLIEP